MFRSVVVLTIALFLGNARMSSAQTDPAQICLGPLQSASRNISITQDSNTEINTYYDQYCDSNGSAKSSDLNIGLDAVVKAIPVKFTLGSNNTTTAISNFCREYKTDRQSYTTRNVYQSTVVVKALETVADCMKVARSGAFITHQILNDEALKIDFVSPYNREITIQGVKTSKNIVCSGQTEAGSAPKFDEASQFKFKGFFTLNCQRDATPSVPSTTSAPEKIFEEGTVSVSTDYGAYAFFVPQQTRLAPRNAADIQTQISTLDKTVTDKLNAVESYSKDSIIRLRKENTFVFGVSGACPDGFGRIGITLWMVEPLDNGRFAAFVSSGFVGPTGGSDYTRKEGMINGYSNWPYAHSTICKRN